MFLVGVIYYFLPLLVFSSIPLTTYNVILLIIAITINSYFIAKCIFIELLVNVDRGFHKIRVFTDGVLFNIPLLINAYILKIDTFESYFMFY